MELHICFIMVLQRQPDNAPRPRPGGAPAQPNPWFRNDNRERQRPAAEPGTAGSGGARPKEPRAPPPPEGPSGEGPSGEGPSGEGQQRRGPRRDLALVIPRTRPVDCQKYGMSFNKHSECEYHRNSRWEY